MSGPYAGDITPQDAWQILSEDPRSVLVDVRTPAEWSYVGIPDLSTLGKKPLLIPWQLFPTMEVNAGFADQVMAGELAADAPLLFLCRSGARSRAAAIALTQKGFQRCFNIAYGFEGDPDASRHRGTVNGWKVEGLPWVQG